MKQRSVTGIDGTVGTRLRAARIEIQMSQAELGAKLGVSFQQIQKYEKGVNRISHGRMQEIAMILKKPITWFADAPVNNGGSDLGAEILSTNHGRRLCEAFLGIPSTEVRVQLVKIAEVIASANHNHQEQQAA